MLPLHLHKNAPISACKPLAEFLAQKCGESLRYSFGMKWVYQFHRLTVEVTFSDSKSRGSQLYGYLESLVTAGEQRLHRDRAYVSGTSLDDIEPKARKLAKTLAKKVADSRDYFDID